MAMSRKMPAVSEAGEEIIKGTPLSPILLIFISIGMVPNKGHFLGSGYHQDLHFRYLLSNNDGGIAGSRRQVNYQIIEFTPQITS